MCTGRRRDDPRSRPWWSRVRSVRCSCWGSPRGTPADTSSVTTLALTVLVDLLLACARDRQGQAVPRSERHIHPRRLTHRRAPAGLARVALGATLLFPQADQGKGALRAHRLASLAPRGCDRGRARLPLLGLRPLPAGHTRAASWLRSSSAARSRADLSAPGTEMVTRFPVFADKRREGRVHRPALLLA